MSNLSDALDSLNADLQHWEALLFKTYHSEQSSDGIFSEKRVKDMLSTHMAMQNLSGGNELSIQKNKKYEQFDKIEQQLQHLREGFKSLESSGQSNTQATSLLQRCENCIKQIEKLRSIVRSY